MYSSPAAVGSPSAFGRVQLVDVATSEVLDEEQLPVDPAEWQDGRARVTLTTKQTGKKAKRPVDPTIEQELKTGAISY